MRVHRRLREAAGGGWSVLPLVLLCATVLWTTAPALTALVREAAGLAGRSYWARRAAVMPSFYESVREIRREVPEDASVGVVFAQRSAIDRAVFVNYYLYPRQVTFFWNLDQYRATSGPRPRELLYLDLRRGDSVRRMTYAEIRREQIAGRGVVASPRPFTAPLRELIVPFAGTAEGWPPDTWTTEAVFTVETPARLTFTLLPFGESRSVALEQGQPLIFEDLVDQLFGGVRTGWIRVDATAPVRAGAWLVNRGRRHVTPLRIYESAPEGRQRVGAGDRLWILNPSAHAVDVLVDGSAVRIAPHALHPLGPYGDVDVEASSTFVAFSSRREGTGPTAFSWPEPRP